MTRSKLPITLLILAGGLGSRYAAAKQVDGIGPNGEFLIEYAIYDALKSGFNKVVVIVNSEVEELLFNRLKKQFRESELTLIQQRCIRNSAASSRVKPWGTGHAVLTAKDHISEPFMMINADDYYGRSTFELGAKHLLKGSISRRKMGLIAFQLSKTLSDFGGVSRGICEVDDERKLLSVKEHEGILRQEDGIYSNQSRGIALKEDTFVSMNCWLLDPSIFTHLSSGFDLFYSIHKNSQKEEYFLPSAMQEIMHTNTTKVVLIESTEKWFGLTYADDKSIAQEKIQEAIDDGFYPKRLSNG